MSADHRPNGDSASHLAADELNRYFTGKYMAARDFECDQAYFRSRLAAQALMSGGWGVVDGLVVRPSPDPDCPDWFIVEAGAAVDPMGRMILLRQDRAIQLDQNHPTVLGIRLIYSGVEPVPMLVGDGTADPNHREMNRIREVAEIVSLPSRRIPPGGWLGAPPWEEVGNPSRTMKQAASTSRGIPALDAASDTSDVVPLAYIDWTPRDGQTLPRIVTAGRRYVMPDGGCRIVAQNWTHGGEMTVSDLKKIDGQLIVAFSGPLLPDPGPGRGLGPQTFQASGGWYKHNRDTRIIPEAGFDAWYAVGEVPGISPGQLQQWGMPADNLYAGVFRMAPSEIDWAKGMVVEVTLYCDFIPDETGRPVDGTPLGGQLPTGDGRPGGTFHSWFTLIDDEPKDEAKAAEAPDEEEQTNDQ